MRKIYRIAALFVVAVILGVPLQGYTCLFEYTFRAYLDRRFWQPFARFASDLERGNARSQEQLRSPYAGMEVGGSKAALQAVRDAYQPLSQSSELVPLEMGEKECALCTKTRQAVILARQTDLTEEEREEVRLVGCKIDLRDGERGN